MLRILLSKAGISIILILVTISVIGIQELRYKSVLLDLQKKESALEVSSKKLADIRNELAEQERKRKVTEDIAREVAFQAKTLRKENSALKKSIKDLSDEAQAYLNTAVPDDISDRLRE